MTKLLGPVAGQRRVDLRHEAVAAREQDAPDLVAVDVLVQGHDSVVERGQLAKKLHAHESVAHHNKGEKPALARGSGSTAARSSRSMK